jgi:hypothetical protein
MFLRTLYQCKQNDCIVCARYERQHKHMQFLFMHFINVYASMVAASLAQAMSAMYVVV